MSNTLIQKIANLNIRIQLFQVKDCSYNSSVDRSDAVNQHRMRIEPFAPDVGDSNRFTMRDCYL